jgi:hypothetical protein
MSKFIVKSLVAELGGQFVVLKREKVGSQGQRGLQSSYAVLDSDTLEKVFESNDKAKVREFIEDQEWEGKAKERAAKRGTLAETLDAGTTGSTVVDTTVEPSGPVVVNDEDDDEVDPEPSVPQDHGIQQPPV